MDEDELEEGELDDDEGECDDAAPDVTDLKTSKCEPDRLADKLRSLSENSLHPYSTDRLENNLEDGEDVDKPDDVIQRQFVSRKHRQGHHHRRKQDAHLKDELPTKKNLKTYGDSDGVADDADHKTPLKWSQNNVWSQSRSPRGPYDSPHSTTDDERDFDDKHLAGRSDRLLPEQMENDRFEHSLHLDRIRPRRRQRRHHSNSAHGLGNDNRGGLDTRGIDTRILGSETRHSDTRGISNDSEFDVPPMGRNYPKETVPSQLPKLPTPSRKRKLVDTPMDERPVCKFFMDGKCVKGDECPFNHDSDFQPSKKPELCRFYMTGGCSKGALCAFYHSDWPCKNFHRRGVCSYGDSCKFSHEELTLETRKLLDMPFGVSEDNLQQQQQQQHTTHQQQQSVAPASEKKKIPSLLDIPIYFPGTAPKSSPPGTISHTEISGFRFFEDDDSDIESNNAPGCYGNGTLRRPPRPPAGRLRSTYVDEDEEQFDEELEDREEFVKHKRRQYSEQEEDVDESNNSVLSEERNVDKRFGDEQRSNKEFNEEKGNNKQFNTEHSGFGNKQHTMEPNSSSNRQVNMEHSGFGNKQHNMEPNNSSNRQFNMEHSSVGNKQHNMEPNNSSNRQVNMEHSGVGNKQHNMEPNNSSNRQFNMEHSGVGNKLHNMEPNNSSNRQFNMEHSGVGNKLHNMEPNNSSNRQVNMEHSGVGNKLHNMEPNSAGNKQITMDLSSVGNKLHDMEPYSLHNKEFNAQRNSNVHFNALPKNMSKFQHGESSVEDESFAGQNSSKRFKTEQPFNKHFDAEQQNIYKWFNKEQKNNQHHRQHNSNKQFNAARNSNNRYGNEQYITIPYDDEDEQYVEDDQYPELQCKKKPCEEDEQDVEEELSELQCKKKQYDSQRNKAEDENYSNRQQRTDAESERWQSKKQNEPSDDIDEEMQRHSYEEVYNVDDADLMRLPAAQRQLFLRIQKNQRQNDNIEGKTDGLTSGNTETGNDDKWYSSDEDERDNTRVNCSSAAGSNTSFSQPSTSHPTSSVQPPPLLFNVPPPPLIRPLIPPPQSAPGMSLPPYGMPIPNVPPPLIPPQQGLPPPVIGMPMHPMNPHRLPPSPSMMGPSMRPEMSHGLLGHGPRQPLPPGIRPGSGLHPPSLLGPNPSHNMMSQGPQPLLSQGGLLGQGPPQPLMRPGPGMMGPAPQPLLGPGPGPGPGANLLGQNMNLPQFDIGQILSAIRNTMTTSAPPSSTSTDPMSPSTSSSVRDPRAATVVSAAAAAAAAAAASDPRLRSTQGKPLDVPDSRGPSVPAATPESPTSPASPPAVDHEVNVAGQRVAYFLRRLTLSGVPPSIPSHVSIDELKQRSDPRLARYLQHGSDPVRGVRRLSATGSPITDHSLSDTVRRRSPSLYTLPDIVLPPLPVPMNNDDTASGTGLSKIPQSRDSVLPRLPEALQEKNSTLTLNKDGALLQRQSSTASSDSDTSGPKKVIDYRNDPRYKKKKTVSRDDIVNRSTLSGEQTDDSFRQTYRSGFYGTCNDEDDLREDFSVYQTFKNCDEVKLPEVHSNWNTENRSISPPTSSSQPSSFLSLTVANSSLVADDDEEQVSLKDMFKTIDPTTSPFC